MIGDTQHRPTVVALSVGLSLLMLMVPAISSGQNRAALGTRAPFKEPKPAKPKHYRDDPPQENMKLVRSLKGHAGKITGLEFTADGKQAVSCSEDGTLRVWNVEDGLQINEVKGLQGGLQSVALSGDGKTAAVGGDSKLLYLCDLSTGSAKQSLDGLSHAIQEVAISLDGRFAAAVDEKGVAQAWDLSSGKGAPLVVLGKPRTFRHLRFNPDGKSLVGSCEFNYPVIWATGTWRYTGGIEVFTPRPNCRMAFTPDGKYLMTATRNSFCVAARSGTSPHYSMEEREVHVSSLSKIEQIGPVGNDYFALYAGDGSVEFWRAKDDQFGGQHPSRVKGVTAAAISPRDFVALTGRADGSLQLWSINGLRDRAEDIQFTALRDIRKMLEEKDFDGLADKADEYRKSRGCFFTGIPVLYAFYLHLNSPVEPKDWVGHQRTLAEWQKAKPDTIAPLVLQAEGLLREGWEARGTGFAASVREDGWKVFREKLEQAMEVIRKAETLKEKDPELHRVEMAILRGRGAERWEIDEAFRKGAAIDPLYFPLYEEGGLGRLQRWGGKEDELAEWAKEVCDGLKDRGDEVYARIAMSVLRYNTDEFFEEMKLDPARIKRGLIYLLDRYDDSNVVANKAAYFAVLMLDRELAQKSFAIMGIGRRDPNVWTTAENFNRWRKWMAPDLPVGQEEKIILGNPHEVRAASVSADGKTLAISGFSYGGYFKLLDTDTWDVKLYRTRVRHYANVLAYNPDDDVIMAGSGIEIRMRNRAPGQAGPPNLTVWDLTGPAPQMRVLQDQTALVLAIAYAPDGSKMAVGGRDGILRIWSPDADKPEAHPLSKEHNEISGLSFNASGEVIAAATRGSGIVLWDVANKKMLDPPPDSKAMQFQGKSMSFSREGDFLAYVDKANSLVVYDRTESKFIAKMPKLGQTVVSVAFSPDSKLLATTTASHTIHLWDIATGKELTSFAGHFAEIDQVFFIAEGRKLLSVSKDCTIRVWNIEKFAASEP